MEQSIRGISTSTTPFITSILAPQLKLRNLPLFFVASLSEVPTITASFSILDGDTVLKQPFEIKKKLMAYMSTQTTSIALTLDRSYKQKIALLELGFHHCIEIPTATEVIIRTIENSVSVSKTSATQLLKEQTVGYQASNSFAYFYDKTGKHFLVNRTKSIYVSVNEQRILEYFLRREGFISKNELAYAGWKHFDVRPNTVTVTIKKLRRKIESVGLPYTIRCLYGYGYILEKTGF